MSTYQREQRRKELEEMRRKVAEARAKRQANVDGGDDGEAAAAATTPAAATTAAAARPAAGLFDQLAASDKLEALLTTIETQVPAAAASGATTSGPSSKGKRVELTLAPALFKFSVEPRETLMYPRRVQVNLLPEASEPAASASDARAVSSPSLSRRDASSSSSSSSLLSSSETNKDAAATTAVVATAATVSSVNVDKLLESSEFLEFLASASVPVERALALNAKYDILTDYTKGRAADGDKLAGSNLTLQARLGDDRWTKFRSVTSLSLSSEFRDMVAVSYSASESPSSNDPDGLVLLWSLHNLLGRPEYVLTCQSPVLSTALNPFDSNMVVGGTYSGQIVVWDIRAKSGQPVRRTSLAALDGHSHPVFCLRVVGSQNAHSLLSISTDGRLCVWRVDDLSQPAEMMEILSAVSLGGAADVASSATVTSTAIAASASSSTDVSSSTAATTAAGESSAGLPASSSSSSLARDVSSGSSSTHPVAVTCMAFSESETNSFLVGSEEGVAYRIVRHAKTKGIETLYSGHFGPITAVDVHPSRGAVDFSGLFITASIDWTVKLWSQQQSSGHHHQQQHRHVPLRSFEDSTDYVADAKWSPVHPAVFASIDGSGVLRLWNLNVDTDAPVAKLLVSEGRSLNHLLWSVDGRKLVVGDTAGNVTLVDAGDLAVPSPNEYATLQATLQRLEDAATRSSEVI